MNSPFQIHFSPGRLDIGTRVFALYSDTRARGTVTGFAPGGRPIVLWDGIDAATLEYDGDLVACSS